MEVDGPPVLVQIVAIFAQFESTIGVVPNCFHVAVIRLHEITTAERKKESLSYVPYPMYWRDPKSAVEVIDANLILRPVFYVPVSASDQYLRMIVITHRRWRALKTGSKSYREYCTAVDTAGNEAADFFVPEYRLRDFEKDFESELKENEDKRSRLQNHLKKNNSTFQNSRVRREFPDGYVYHGSVFSVDEKNDDNFLIKYRDGDVETVNKTALFHMLYQ